MSMRCLLGLVTVLATLLLSGCGDEQPDVTAADPSSTPSSSPGAERTTSPEPAAVQVVALISASYVGGQVAERATVLDDGDALDEFAARFDSSRMAQQLEQELAAAPLPEGQPLAAAVVDISCTPPEKGQVTATQTNGTIEVTAAPSKDKGTVQCLAPVTTVALVTVPS